MLDAPDANPCRPESFVLHSPDSRHRQLHAAMTERRDVLLDLHRDLVRIPSVNAGDGSSARETEVAECAAAFLRAEGVEAEIVEGAPGRGNLLARWRPPGRREPLGNRLLLISHADVVPPGDESQWRHPPFSAARENGRIWGRGVNDCKMLVACELFALACIARTRSLVTGEVRLAVGADEEAGGRFGFGWLARHRPDFLRADLAINEGGGAFLTRDPDGRDVFLLGTGEKGRYEIVFSVEGPGTHASVPWGRPNPAVQIAELIARISAWGCIPIPDAPILSDFREIAGLRGPASAENLGETLDAARNLSRSFFNSLMAQTRTTMVPTVLRAGEKSNAVPTSAELRCDARILPGQSPKVLEDAVRELLAGLPHVDFRIEETARASVSKIPSGLPQVFQRASGRALDPDGNLPPEARTPRVIPTWCTGFTDSRFIRDSGTPTFGFQLVSPEADPDRLGIHCIDESIDEGMLLPCALSLAHLALDFCEFG
jgi:acetylornithine deacetylase/succinyl-diaminopimelate desuccinylase-like protein